MSQEQGSVDQEVTITATLGGWYTLLAYLGDYPISPVGIQHMCALLNKVQHTLSDVTGAPRVPDIFKPEAIQAEQDAIDELSRVFGGVAVLATKNPNDPVN